jgi:hypothetical protein
LHSITRTHRTAYCTSLSETNFSSFQFSSVIYTFYLTKCFSEFSTITATYQTNSNSIDQAFIQPFPKKSIVCTFFSAHYSPNSFTNI